nr:hypothetical protein SEVIR_8G236400v2 [Setaria viridis]
MEDGDLAKLNHALGRKVSFVAAVFEERMACREKGALAQVSRLEARVALLEKENKLLEDIKGELGEINKVLKEDKDALMKTTQELGEKYEKLDDKNEKLEEENMRLRGQLEDNAKVIEKLRLIGERDARAIAELNRCVDIMGPELEQKTKLINEAEDLLKEKFTTVYEVYKASLEAFGAEPYPCPVDEGCERIFEWMQEEFGILPEVLSGLNDYSALFCAEGIFQLLEKEGCEQGRNQDEHLEGAK